MSAMKVTEWGAPRKRKWRRVRGVECSRCDKPRDRNGRYCRACHNEYRRKTRHKMAPETLLKEKCRAYANTYQRRGKLTPQPCLKCGSLKVEKHHPDYSKPLEVVWLCRPCHRRLHEEE